MAIDSEAKRWSMLALASSPPRTIVFNPDTSGVVSIERITVLQKYGGIAWDAPVAPSPVPFMSMSLTRRVGISLSNGLCSIIHRLSRYRDGSRAGYGNGITVQPS